MSTGQGGAGQGGAIERSEAEMHRLVYEARLYLLATYIGYPRDPPEAHFKKVSRWTIEHGLCHGSCSGTLLGFRSSDSAVANLHAKMWRSVSSRCYAAHVRFRSHQWKQQLPDRSLPAYTCQAESTIIGDHKLVIQSGGGCISFLSPLCCYLSYHLQCRLRRKQLLAPSTAQIQRKSDERQHDTCLCETVGMAESTPSTALQCIHIIALTV